jgi:hypothetical protein
VANEISETDLFSFVWASEGSEAMSDGVLGVIMDAATLVVGVALLYLLIKVVGK